jgi:hypothetical protein
MAIAPIGPARFLLGALAVARQHQAAHWIAQGGSPMAKFVQVCASQNDLFALDEDGEIYQYHFNVKTWAKLIATRELEEAGRAPQNERAGWREEGRQGEER